jgi:hypothetical protein
MNFSRPSLFCPILTNTCICSHPVTNLKGSLPCNCTRCKTCPIHIPTQSFSSPKTNLIYPITILADCKSSNLVYQLQCKKYNAFFIGENGQMLSKCLNGHQSTCIVVNFDLPDPPTPSSITSLSLCPCHWQTPWCHPDHVCHQFEMAYQHSNSLLVSTSGKLTRPLTPPIPLSPASGTCEHDV